MSARKAHLEAMVPELDAMREDVASTARNDSDVISHRAHMKQAQSLRAIYGQIASTWFNAEQEVMNELGEVVDDVVELRYVTRLSEWLRAHVARTVDLTEGGVADISSQSSGVGEREVQINRLYAIRHHKMIAEFCERSALALDERACQLRSDGAFHP